MRVDRGALEIARVDIGDSRNARPALAWVEVGVQHAAGSGELQFGPVAFPDLKSRPTEMLAQFVGGHPIQGGMVMTVGLNRFGRGRLDRPGGRGCGAAGNQQRGKSYETTHPSLVAGRSAACKLAPGGRRR